jgi:DNA (cytosine-5)-methyltransferase 1
MQLRRLGYKVHMKVLNAQKHNGYTMRKRAYIFATMLDSEFSFPEPVSKSTHFWNDLIAGRENEMSDKSNNKAIIDALTTGRSRFVQAGSDTGFTLLKSQARLAKDTLLCDIDGKIMYPSLSQSKDMMNAGGMDLSLFSEEVAMEIVGQGVCLHLHDALMEQVKLHIDQHMAMKESPIKQAEKENTEDTIENRLAQSFYPALTH